MQIVNLSLIAEFERKHPLSRSPLNRWVRETQAAQWNSLADIRKTFNATDYADQEYIFNIHGNKYRLYSDIIFMAKIVLITDIRTHAEYDKRQK